MIKYKSGFKKEDLYRLYSTGYVENGKKYHTYLNNKYLPFFKEDYWTTFVYINCFK